MFGCSLVVYLKYYVCLWADGLLVGEVSFDVVRIACLFVACGFWNEDLRLFFIKSTV